VIKIWWQIENTAVSSSMTDYSRGSLLVVTFLTREMNTGKLRTWFKRADFYKIQSRSSSFNFFLFFFFSHGA